MDGPKGTTASPDWLVGRVGMTATEADQPAHVDIRRRVVYRDENVVVLRKPAGVAVQDEEGEVHSGFFQVVKAALDLAEARPVHRLDRDTSGLYLIAVHARAAADIGRQFELGLVGKVYLALSAGRGHKKQGWVIGDMVAARNGNRKLLHSRQSPAITYFHSIGLAPGLRANALRLYTGRTHQARVALKSVGAAILGDERYGGAPADRLYLHAAVLSFTLPDGRPLAFTSPPDAEDGPMWGQGPVEVYAHLLSRPWPVSPRRGPGGRESENSVGA